MTGDENFIQLNLQILLPINLMQMKIAPPGLLKIIQSLTQ